MRMRKYGLFVVAAIVVLVVIGTPARAGTPGRVCRADVTCQSLTALCTQLTQHPRRCRRVVVKECKQAGVEVCASGLAALCQGVSDPACPTTTTTTLPSPPPGGGCPQGYPVDCFNGICCSAAYPVCQADGGCCSAAYPVGCGNGYCCPADYPVCYANRQCGR